MSSTQTTLKIEPDDTNTRKTPLLKVSNFSNREECERSIKMLHDWQVLNPLLTNLMKLQELPEVLQGKSLYKNKVGLNRFDSSRFTSIYKKYQNKIAVSDKEITVLRKKIVKYWGQL